MPDLKFASFRGLIAALIALLGVVSGVANGQSGEVDTGPVAVRAVPQWSKVAAGSEVVIAVEMNHPDGYHSWPNMAVSLSKSIDEFAIRTEVGLAKGAPAALRVLGTQWPTAAPGKVPDPTGDQDTVTVPLFSGRVVTYLVVSVAADAAPGELKVPVTVHYQSCDEHMCYPEKRFTLEVPVIVGTVASDANEPALFAGFNRTKVVGVATPSPTPPPNGTNATSAAPAASPTLLGIGLGSGLIVLFLASMLGGAVLNLTPCVLPIIPIKVMSLVEHAGSPRRRALLGTWMALGVIAFWTAMGLPMAAFSSLDPTRLIFGTWWVTLGLSIVIAVMGLGIMGLFAINLPQAVYMVSPKADSAKGSFFYGVMTGVLGLPCFGFVAGGLLAGSASLPPVTIVMIFVGLGVGMAAPYLVLTMKPGLINRIPRTGPASELVKQVLGLLILAAAGFFLSSSVQTLIMEKPYVAASMPFWAAAFFVLIAGLWLTARTLMISKKAWPRILMPLLALVCVGGAIGFALASTVADRASVWKPFTSERFAQAGAEGKVIVVDYTASWCITCKGLKRAVLDREPVISELRKPDVVPLESDVSSDTDPGWESLKALGQTGVPTLVIYGPGLPKPLVYNAYTKDIVVKAIQRARGK